MKNILVVEDNKDFLYIIRGSLRRMAHHIAVSGTCRDAIKMLSAFCAVLIVMDVNVGEEDGWHTCRTIKAMAIHARTTGQNCL